jgi:hypothetical protein
MGDMKLILLKTPQHRQTCYRKAKPQSREVFWNPDREVVTFVVLSRLLNHT